MLWLILLNQCVNNLYRVKLVSILNDSVRFQKIRVTGMNRYPHPVHAGADSVPNKDMSSSAWSDVSEMDGWRNKESFRSEVGANV